MKLKERLVTRLMAVHPKNELPPWFKGYIPYQSNYIRNTIPPDKRLYYAFIGWRAFMIEFNINLYFTQAMIVGAFISGDYATGRVIAIPRWGKSYIMGALADYLAKYSYHVSIVASRTNRTAKVMEHARKALRDSNAWMKDMLVDEEQRELSKADKLLGRSEIAYSRHNIVFKNGNKISTKSTGEAFSSKDTNENIGEGSHVLIDEMDFISEEALTELGRREFESDDGRSLILFGISNPRFLNHFYEDMTKPDEAMKANEFVVWMDVVTAIEEDNIKMTADEILASDFTKTEESIRTNLLCEYDEEQSEFFNAPFVTESHDRLNEVTKTTIATIGVDSAYKGTDGITIALTLFDSETNESRNIKILDTINLRPDEWSDARSTKEIVDGIEQIVKAYNVKAISVDVGQGSHLIVEMAQRESLTSIIQYPIDFGARPTPEKVKIGIDTAVRARNKRAEMHLVLQQLMQEGRVVYSEHLRNRLLPQMRVIQTKNTDLQKMTLIDKSIIREQLKRSPDDLDAVVLSVHALELYLLGVR